MGTPNANLSRSFWLQCYSSCDSMSMQRFLDTPCLEGYSEDAEPIWCAISYLLHLQVHSLRGFRFLPGKRGRIGGDTPFAAVQGAMGRDCQLSAKIELMDCRRPPHEYSFQLPLTSRQLQLKHIDWGHPHSTHNRYAGPPARYMCVILQKGVLL